MENLGINVSTLVAGLGVTGVAVALATQSLVSDLFASVSIILDKPFLVGDFIVLDSGYQGTVERIGIRTTRLRSLSGEELVFANSDLGKTRVRNFRSLRERRIVFGFSLRYETPMAQLERITDWLREAIEDAGEDAGNTRFDRADMLTFGESGLGFEVVYYVLDGSYNVYTAVQQDINFRIMRLFASHDIQFAYRTTLVLKAEDLAQQSREMAA
jgi:small-conductance mechanosensitive channel